MSKENWDVVQGALILVPVLVLAFLAGKILYAHKSRQHIRAWSPLLPLLNNGTVTNDGGGAATSWLSGDCQGQPVVAAITPHRNRHSGDGGGPRYNHFSVQMQKVAGDRDWAVVRERSLLGLRNEDWKLRAEDEELAKRLLFENVIEHAGAANCLAIRFDTRGGTLTLERDVGPSWTPTVLQFQRDLELLLHLARIPPQPDKNS